MIVHWKGMESKQEEGRGGGYRRGEEEEEERCESVKWLVRQNMIFVLVSGLAIARLRIEISLGLEL